MKTCCAVFTTLLIVGPVCCSLLANLFIDNLLSTSYLNEIDVLALDPAVLPDFQTDFEDKVALIRSVTGRFEFTKGRMTGLSQPRRFSECRSLPKRRSNTTAINCTISFDELKVNYNGRMRYGKIPRVRINARGVITGAQVMLEVIQFPMMPPTTQSFSVTNVGTATARLGGLSPLNRFTKAQEDTFKGYVQAKVYNLMNERLQYALQRAVSKVPLSVI